MIIGFDASRAFNKNRTGTENYSYQLLLNLSKVDHTNTYKVYLRPGVQITSKPEKPDALTHRRTDEPIIWPSNFHFITIPYPKLWTQVGLAKQTFIDKDLDVLFVPSHTLPLIHKPGLKAVVTVHDLGAEYLPKTHQLKQRLYLKLMTDYQLKSASHLIAVSNATKEDLSTKVGITKDKISVVYEGYNKELFKPITGTSLNTMLKEFGLEEDQYFFFVGTIQPRKNLERLIKAFQIVIASETKQSQKEEIAASRFDGTRNNEKQETQNTKYKIPDTNQPQLVLAGSKGWLSDEIYALPKKLGIEDHVKFLGYVPDKKLPALYSGAKAFLFPSLFEGFGLPILEAFACNCPVLTSNISSMPEIAGDAAVLVDPYSTEDIARGINKIMIQDPPAGGRFKIQEGCKQIKKFSWEKCAKETLEILEKNSKS